MIHKLTTHLFALILSATVLTIAPTTSYATVGGDAGEGSGEAGGPVNYTFSQLLRLHFDDLPVISLNKDAYTLDGQKSSSDLVWELAQALRGDRRTTLRVIRRINQARTPEEKAALISKLAAQFEKDFQTVRLDVVRMKAQIDQRLGEATTPGSYASALLWLVILGEDKYERSVGFRGATDAEKIALQDADDRLLRIAFVGTFLDEWAKHPELEIRP